MTSCTETVERVKVAIQREEERVRAKTAQAMALKTQWKQQQVFAAIETAVASDLEEALRATRTEIKTLLDTVRRVDAHLWEQAAMALHHGNRDLARAILMERAALRSALSA